MWLPDNRIMKITSVLLWVQENRVSEKFYKKLGFDIVRANDSHSVMSLGGFELVLVNMRDEEEFAKDSMTAEKGRGMYIYISVDNVDAKHRELLDKGFQLATVPRNWSWGNREFILKDPDGYKLCFWQPLND